MSKSEADKQSPETPTTTATFATDAWGIPNWREAEAYGDTNRWTLNRWRWEFYRRREDLREYFCENAENQYQLKQRVFADHPTSVHVAKPNDPDFILIVDWENQLKFGYQMLPNPQFGSQPEWIINPSRQNVGLEYIIASERYTSYAIWLEAACSMTGSQVHENDLRGILKSLATKPAFVDEQELGLIFRLDLPLGPQLEKAKNKLQVEQKKQLGKLLQERKHPKKWLNYLRTLDARKAGATWAQISNLHPRTKQTDQTARDIWEAANALRFNF